MSDPKTVVILGGGIGGLVAANELKKKARNDVRVILIDKSPSHVYAASFLWLMLGKRRAERIQRPLSLLAKRGIEFVNDEIVRIEPERKTVSTKQKDFQYDYLIVSLGAQLVPDKIPGLARGGYNLYELKEAERLQGGLRDFTGGRVAVVISSLPFKCPAAPYEAAFLLDEHFQKKGVRGKTEITVYTPEALPMPSAGLKIGKAVKGVMEARNIKFNPEAQVTSVDTEKKELVFKSGRNEHFDLLVYVPPHEGTAVVRASGLGNEMGWIPVDAKTLKTKHENVYAIGDSAAITLVSGKPLPKAGVFAHLQAEVVVENILSDMRGLPASKKYDGRAYCFLELGFGRAGFAAGNFYAEPAPAVTMRQPGRFWHLGKLLVEKYWLWKWL